ncbi:thioredoxin family protein [Thermovibrio sp.]
MKLVLFTSDRCAVCLPLKEKLKKVAEELEIELKEVKIEENPQEAAQKLIFSAPTVVLEEEGKELKRWSGVFSVEDIKTTLLRLLS